MIAPDFDSPILGGRAAAEHANLPIQERLIAISAVQRDTRPLHSTPASQTLNHTLEPHNAAIHFRSQTHCVAKQLNKALRAITRLVLNITDARDSRLGRQLAKSICDRWMPHQRPPQ